MHAYRKGWIGKWKYLYNAWFSVLLQKCDKVMQCSEARKVVIKKCAVVYNWREERKTQKERESSMEFNSFFFFFPMTKMKLEKESESITKVERENGGGMVWLQTKFPEY